MEMNTATTTTDLTWVTVKSPAIYAYAKQGDRTAVLLEQGGGFRVVVSDAARTHTYDSIDPMPLDDAFRVGAETLEWMERVATA